MIGWRAAGLLFNGIELSDPTDGLPGDWGALRPVDIDRLASDMGHAGDLADGTGAMQILEPGATIGMHSAAEAGEGVLWDAGPFLWRGIGGDWPATSLVTR